MARLRLHVTPGARVEAIVGWRGESLHLKVRERPQKGRANEAVLRLLARHLRLPHTSLGIVHGAASRHKLVQVDGVSDEELRARLGEATP